LIATATCPQHVEAILATSFRLQDECAVHRAPSRRCNIEIRTGELQVGKGAETVRQMLRETEDPEIPPEGTWETVAFETVTGQETCIIFSGTVSAAEALTKKLRVGLKLGDDAYGVMHSKLTLAEKTAVLKQLMGGQFHALVGTSIMQMGIDKAGLLNIIIMIQS
jgi:superfamily II DNA/RNA helicase